jgi:hypothetical protein
MGVFNVKMCVLLDLERTIISGKAHYWKPNKMGYTTDIAAAGRYPESLANQIANDDIENKTVVIPQSLIDNIYK